MAAIVSPSQHRSGDPEPIETASAEDLQSLQLERLDWSLQHACSGLRQPRARSP
jgi:hypothetical protein